MIIPIKVNISNRIRILHNVDLEGIKISGNYVERAIAYAEARKRGYHDTILLDSKDKVLEASSSNVFIVKNNKIYTPISNSIRKGVTRDSVIEIASHLGYSVNEKILDKKILNKSDELFLTSTGKGLISVNRLCNKKIEVGEVTKTLRKFYIDTISGKIPEYENWLTIVNNR